MAKEKRDPAFLFYDGDAARDVSHLNRLERGCYFDLLQAQKKFGGFTLEQARKILGRDFEGCWSALELVLTEENGIFFIEWVRDSISDRKIFAQKNKERIQNYWDKKKKDDTTVLPQNNHGNSNVLPYEDENEIENEDEIVNRLKDEKNFQIKEMQEPEIEVYPTFEDFWSEYDKKVGEKGKIKKKWLALTLKEREAIMDYIPNYKVSQPEKRYRKNPDTFLNNKSWNDELIISNGTKQTTNDKATKWANHFANRASEG
jgi:hypothetical protein